MKIRLLIPESEKFNGHRSNESKNLEDRLELLNYLMKLDNPLLYYFFFFFSSSSSSSCFSFFSFSFSFTFYNFGSTHSKFSKFGSGKSGLINSARCGKGQSGRTIVLSGLVALMASGATAFST